ncbi:PREDICTED: probable xyloglucan endotransglucosylase/hydrolase protein 25 [Erythranthe guttata]|uniref:probable xyloglucan endotransglucosylase/hydrolase protein 25 n=1 Tax=Erythranthe guttata TaxID=4155 RepID=UPI00064DCDF1|nr:PREDICTED: probable xyloglucan endotransglucosylase/hydrolase protein 25 [Erythranthe guttata]|eukprot:XP_012837529.1 PREDICTED: probable xyloglucan endotransglucosylase/hydrolase protein 25 [Erythranthe guttata]
MAFTYYIIVSMHACSYMVDNIPIRVFNNYIANGVQYPTSQPMKVYASLWNADDWATQGGQVKTDWTKAPFTATYKNYNANGCIVNGTTNSCTNKPRQSWQTMGLDANAKKKIQTLQQKYMIYNYCTDLKRFPQGLPRECGLPKF